MVKIETWRISDPTERVCVIADDYGDTRIPGFYSTRFQIGDEVIWSHMPDNGGDHTVEREKYDAKAMRDADILFDLGHEDIVVTGYGGLVIT